MRSMKRRLLSLILMAMALLLVPVCATAAYTYIDISNPFLRKIPIAAPTFKSMQQNSQTTDAAAQGARMLGEALTYTGYFKLIDARAFLVEPSQMAIEGSGINFKNWTDVGAEMLVTGGVQIQQQALEMELRLFDTFKGEVLVGKKYRGWPQDLRRMILKFAGEIIEHISGSRGVFDSRIAFVSKNGKQKEIYLCDFDGQNPVQFTQDSRIALSPAWSFDGRWLAYTAFKNGKPDLFLQNVTEKRGVIIDQGGINISPAWMPGRFELAATLSLNGEQEIYLLSGQGQIIRKLTDNYGIDVSPTWSPNGRKIAFVSKRAGTPQIYIKDLVSQEVERLTFQGNNNTQPNWSPKGDWIAYTAMIDGRNQIMIIRTTDHSIMQLTEGDYDNESPSWSPDGSLIVFSSTREGMSRIYVMTAFGTDPRRLLSLPGIQSEPAWSPNIEP